MSAAHKKKMKLFIVSLLLMMGPNAFSQGVSGTSSSTQSLEQSCSVQVTRLRSGVETLRNLMDAIYNCHNQGLIFEYTDKASGTGVCRDLAHPRHAWEEDSATGALYLKLQVGSNPNNLQYVYEDGSTTTKQNFRGPKGDRGADGACPAGTCPVGTDCSSGGSSSGASSSGASSSGASSSGASSSGASSSGVDTASCQNANFTGNRTCTVGKCGTYKVTTGYAGGGQTGTYHAAYGEYRVTIHNNGEAATHTVTCGELLPSELGAKHCQRNIQTTVGGAVFTIGVAASVRETGSNGSFELHARGDAICGNHELTLLP